MSALPFNRFRLLTAAEGATLAQCLACGEPSSFTVSTMLDCSGRARLTETIPFRPDHRLQRPQAHERLNVPPPPRACERAQMNEV
jgi:hypothetical protein